MKGPKAYIHLDRLSMNYKIIQRHLNNNPIMAVVKADGYGHGAVECAAELEKEGCRYFAVFTFEEAIQLRDSGINSKILVFSRLQKEFLEMASKQKITLNLSDVSDIPLLDEYYKESGNSPEFHLKVDTGMSRLGIPFEDIGNALRDIRNKKYLRCDGLYSHYATADEGDLSYAQWQLGQFNLVLSLAEEMGISIKYRHFSNSGTVLNLPESYFDIVRVGILLYGVFPSNEVSMDLPVKPVMEFRGPIIATRQIQKGTKVSYGGVWVAEKDCTLGIIQTGFADGYPRQWYESGFIVYNGKPYPIAGRVCMDQFMVDFGNEAVTVGEEVLFMGENGEDSLHVETISESINTTSYVLLTDIHGRTERIFKKT